MSLCLSLPFSGVEVPISTQNITFVEQNIRCFIVMLMPLPPPPSPSSPLSCVGLHVYLHVYLLSLVAIGHMGLSFVGCRWSVDTWQLTKLVFGFRLVLATSVAHHILRPYPLSSIQHPHPSGLVPICFAERPTWLERFRRVQEVFYKFCRHFIASWRVWELGRCGHMHL